MVVLPLYVLSNPGLQSSDPIEFVFSVACVLEGERKFFQLCLLVRKLNTAVDHVRLQRYET